MGYTSPFTTVSELQSNVYTRQYSTAQDYIKPRPCLGPKDATLDFRFLIFDLRPPTSDPRPSTLDSEPSEPSEPVLPNNKGRY